ncbi:MAG: polymer-forming cytoskeletal protein [Flavobacteriaceae bacterium]|nr:polymer-forming cytoskeletal protein [Flavobacteriaceae bacterium]
MFSEKKPKPEIQILERNVIGKNTSFVGNLISEGDFRIDGNVEGTINVKGKVVIGKDSIIKGTIICSDADIEGIFTGKLYVSNTLSLKLNAVINGEVNISKLSVEPGATFNASCNMKGVNYTDEKNNG